VHVFLFVAGFRRRFWGSRLAASGALFIAVPVTDGFAADHMPVLVIVSDGVAPLPDIEDGELARPSATDYGS
jgi:hypothetical protein